jgi:hypothetical protein
MSADDPNPASGDDQGRENAIDEAPSQPAESGWPELDEQALKGKLYMKAGGVDGGSVAVTASEGPITAQGAPAGLFAKLAEVVGATLAEVGNMVAQPLVLAAGATNSMTIVYGEPASDPDEIALPIRTTLQSGVHIGNLIATEEEEELIGRARQLGRGARSYVDLVRLVHSEGIDLKWQVGQDPPHTLTSVQAGLQLRRLTAPPRRHVREMDVDGLLYRAIWEGPGEGRVGLKLSKHSPKPPRRHGGTVVLLFEEDRRIEDLVMHQLLGQSVVARIEVTEFDIATNVLGEAPPHATIKDIEKGARLDTIDLLENAYGPALDDDDEDLTDDER